MGNGHFNKLKHKVEVERNMDFPISAIQKSEISFYLVSVIANKSFPYHLLSDYALGSIIKTNNPLLANLNVSSPFLKSYTLKEQTDAVLYFGKPSLLTEEEDLPFQDKKYELELERRRNLKKCND